MYHIAVLTKSKTQETFYRGTAFTVLRRARSVSQGGLLPRAGGIL